jgi:hypothetical protein
MKQPQIWMFWLIAVQLAGFSASAKPWKGMTPGQTKRIQVIDKFGPPSKEFSQGGKLSDGITYQGKRAIEGAEQANFFFDKHGTLFRIDVYPSKKLNREQITKVFGNRYVERVTSKGHRFFDYQQDGMIVFFRKDTDQVSVFTFQAAMGAKAKTSTD